MIAVGDFFILREAVERGPFTVPAGAAGRVVEASPEFVSLRLLKPVPGAEEWDNEVHFRLEDAADRGQADVEALVRLVAVPAAPVDPCAPGCEACADEDGVYPI